MKFILWLHIMTSEFGGMHHVQIIDHPVHFVTLHECEEIGELRVVAIKEPLAPGHEVVYECELVKVGVQVQSHML